LIAEPNPTGAKSQGEYGHDDWSWQADAKMKTTKWESFTTAKSPRKAPLPSE